MQNKQDAACGTYVHRAVEHAARWCHVLRPGTRLRPSKLHLEAEQRDAALRGERTRARAPSARCSASGTPQKPSSPSLPARHAAGSAPKTAVVTCIPV